MVKLKNCDKCFKKSTPTGKQNRMEVREETIATSSKVSNTAYEVVQKEYSTGEPKKKSNRNLDIPAGFF